MLRESFILGPDGQPLIVEAKPPPEHMYEFFAYETIGTGVGMLDYHIDTLLQAQGVPAEFYKDALAIHPNYEAWYNQLLQEYQQILAIVDIEDLYRDRVPDDVALEDREHCPTCGRPCVERVNGLWYCTGGAVHADHGFHKTQLIGPDDDYAWCL